MIIPDDINAKEAIEKVLECCNFKTVLDIGCGDGRHSDIFAENGKIVTACDYGESYYFRKNPHKINTLICDFNKYNFSKKFDLVWASHILEHQININNFLTKIYNLIHDKGWLAITVPPLKHTIVGGHVSIWNAGLLLYNLILAGFDCSNAKVKKYGYNISVIVKKEFKTDLTGIEFDAGDIQKLQKYFPKNLVYEKSHFDTPFNGDITEMNWN